MLDAPDPDWHFWLTMGMARALGVSLTAALASGDLTRAELDAAVERCRLCPVGEACLYWLGRHASGTRTVPGFCANRSVFTSLPQLR